MENLKFPEAGQVLLIENNFTPDEVELIRGLTGTLGGIVERVILNIWQHRGVEGLSLKRDELKRTTLQLMNILRDTIGTERLHPKELAYVYQSVIMNNTNLLICLIEQVDIICKASGESFSFLNGLPLILNPNYLFGRYWIEAALMIAKEACLDPLLILDDFAVIKRGVTTQRGVIDGIVIPFSPGLDDIFKNIQSQFTEWVVIEMKAIFAWWRNVGINPLQSVPGEYARALNHHLETIALLTPRYNPDHGRLICCFRGCRPTRIFYLAWWSNKWEMMEREL